MEILMIGVILLWLILAFVGARRGLFRSLFGVIAIVVSLAGTRFLSPYVGDWLIADTKIDDVLEDKIYGRLENSLLQEITDSLKKQGVVDNLAHLAEEETQYAMSQTLTAEQETDRIENLPVPERIQKKLMRENQPATYEKLGVDNFYHYIARYLAREAVSILALAVTYLLIRLVLILINWGVNRILRRVAIAGAADRILGFLLGALTGLFFVWLFLTICEFAYGGQYQQMIADSPFLLKLSQTNILMNLIAAGQ